jgi:DNA-binding PadR family transcriptional regulator
MSDEPTRITAPFLDVLEAFLAAGGGELYGWAIIRTSQRGGPTVYKILERLTDMGWVTARWEDQPAQPNKPRRRFYRLTGEGAGRARSVLNKHRPERAWQTLRPAWGGIPR